MFNTLKANRNQILAVLLIAIIGFNCYVHFSSPIIHDFNSFASELRRDNDIFKSKIVNDFIPAITAIATNRVGVASSVSGYSPFKVENLPVSLGIIDGRFFVCGSRSGFYWDDRSFFVGDDFFGFPILGVSPTIVTTAQGFFYLRKPPYYGAEKNENEKGALND